MLCVEPVWQNVLINPLFCKNGVRRLPNWQCLTEKRIPGLKRYLHFVSIILRTVTITGPYPHIMELLKVLYEKGINGNCFE